MRVAILQGFDVAVDKAGALDHLAIAARDAAAAGADLLIAPEMFLTGYNIGPEVVGQLAEAVDGPSAARAAAIAAEAGIALVYGYPERGEDGAVYNAAMVIDAAGQQLLNHRKCHLFGELDRSAFAAGQDMAPVVTIAGVKVGVLICYDVEFPEAVRRLALAGAELVAVPTALMQPFDVIARIIVPARAFENQVFVAYANRSGTEADLTYVGLSCIVAPDGTDLARADRTQALIMADIDPAIAEAARAANPYLADRRPELYGTLA